MSAALAYSRPLPHPRCPFCSERAQLVDKSVVYVGEPTKGGKVWLCWPCDAWVLAHGDFPHRPTGTLAKGILRAKRAKAARLFDQVWRTAAKEDRSRTESEWRSVAYAWLASELGISPSRCQIGFFGHVQAQAVIDICMSVGGKKDVAA
jgi:hypothetical protein